MSRTTPSPHLPFTGNGRRLVAAFVDRIGYGIRAAAFWIAALLPLLVVVALAAGVGTQRPELLAAAVTINAVCAVVGHGHTPSR